MKVKCSCERSKCSKVFYRRKADVDRARRVNGAIYCSLSCAALENNKGRVNRHPEAIAKYAGNRRTLFTPFKWFVARARYRDRKQTLTVSYLERLWEGQQGICPITGWHLILPTSTTGFDKNVRPTRCASLDRLNNAKGYVPGNVRFVSRMFNNVRGDLDDKDVIEFCRAVVRHNS